MRCFRARHTAGMGEERARSAGYQRLVREQIRGSLCNRNAREKETFVAGGTFRGAALEPARSRSSGTRERGLVAGLDAVDTALSEVVSLSGTHKKV